MKKNKCIFVKILMLVSMLFTQILPTSLVFALETENVDNKTPKIEIINKSISYVGGDQILDNDGIYNINDVSINLVFDLKYNDEIVDGTTSEEKYYVVERLNGLVYSKGLLSADTRVTQKFSSVLYLNSNYYDNTLSTNFITGAYLYSLEIYDEAGELVDSENVKFNYTNNNEEIVIDFTGDDIDINFLKLVQFQVLTEEEKVNLFGEEEESLKIKEINDYIRKYNNKVIFDLFLNNNTSNLVFNSYEKINDIELSLISGLKGKFDKENVSDPRIMKSDIDSLFNSFVDAVGVRDENIKYRILNSDKEIVEESAYLSTGMQLEVIYYGIKNVYTFVVSGNILSKDGLIKQDSVDGDISSINGLLDLVVNASNLDKTKLPYLLAGNVNGDDKVNILDASNMMNIMMNSSYDWGNIKSLDKISSGIKYGIINSSNNIRVGDTFIVSLYVSNFNNDVISGVQGKINFSDNVSLTNIKSIDNWLISANGGNFIMLSNNIKSNVSKNQTILEFTFKANAVGDTKIDLRDLMMAYDGKALDISNNSDVVEVNVLKKLSSNNNIKSLTFNTGNLDGEFNSENLEYTLNVGYYTKKIIINGLLEDENAITTGFKEYDLSGNKTVISIPVTAEDGSIKTYTVNVIRIDNRSGNNYLASLSIEGYDLSFNKNTLEYSIIVGNDVTKINLKAIAEFASSTVYVSGDDSLVVGENTVTITVHAENGNVKTYKVKVNREKANEIITDDDDNDGSDSSKLVLIVLIFATLGALIYLIFNGDNKKTDIPNFKLKEKNDDKVQDDVIPEKEKKKTSTVKNAEEVKVEVVKKEQGIKNKKSSRK